MAEHAQTHRRRKRNFFHKHLTSIILLGVAGFFLGAGIILLWASFIKLPDFNSFQERKIVESTKIYDRTGKILLYDVHENIKRTIVPFDAISPLIKAAAIAVEDSGFYSHPGVSIRGLARAVLYGGTRGGGSTITQQVIKKTLLTDERLVTRKLKELILSFKLEQAFTKDEILALYLNEIPYGGNIYGIGEASTAFFGKPPSELTLAESAYLAAIPNAPTRLSPYGNNRNLLDERKNFVLKRMYDLGFITESDYASARAEKVTFLPKESRGIKAPHFVMWIQEYLASKYGERAVEESGYRVITTLDYELQKKADEVVDRFAADTEKNFNAKNMALVAINPKNGNVLAMVGSRDYFNIENEGNFNVALAHRQPGSTFKPFVYGTAFMKGYTPETALFDLPTNFSTNCDARGNPLSPNIKKEDCYMPENYDGKYRGPVTMREALAQSLNVPAVKTLYLAGLNDSIATAKRMGITSLTDPDRYGLTLVLGGGEVSLLELTGAYGVFANDGIKNPTQTILRIEDKDGRVIEEFQESPEEVLSSDVARDITSILSDNKARTPAFGATSALYFPGKDIAVKTGTTNDYRDVWTVGYTPNIAVGMWAGNNDNTPMQKNVAGMIIAPIWHAFMEEALKITPPERFIAPEPKDLSSFPAPLAGVWQGGEKYIIDTASGKLATANTPTEMKKVVVVPNIHTILHWVNKNDPRGGQPVRPQNDPQYMLWEIPVRSWAATQSIREGDRSGIPTTYDTTHSAASAPILSINGVDFSVPHNSTERLVFSVTSNGVYSLSRVELFVNGQPLDQKTVAPFSFSFVPEDIDGLTKENEITVVGYDSVLNKGVYSVKLQIP
ncbi:MAG: transglycosylase domain-containing protein [Minisyncoccota bacterium]